MDQPTLDIVMKFIQTGRNEWEEIFKNLNLQPSEMQEVERLADRIAMECGLLSGYLGKRGADGCGDSGKHMAFQSGLKVYNKVRRALGYTVKFYKDRS